MKEPPRKAYHLADAGDGGLFVIDRAPRLPDGGGFWEGGEGPGVVIPCGSDRGCAERVLAALNSRDDRPVPGQAPREIPHDEETN